MAEPPTDRAARWESRYQADDMPWDSADAEPELLRRLGQIGLPPLPPRGAGGGHAAAARSSASGRDLDAPPPQPSPDGGGSRSALPGREGRSVEVRDSLRAIDLGCGTGANAIALAARGFAVIACDIAPKAIEMARQRAEKAGVNGIAFHIADVLEALPVESDSIDFAFDRGCFHTVTPALRSTFVDRVADALKPGGWWLTLAGNRDDDPKFDRPGPPQLTAAALTAAVEPRFEVHDLARIRFTDDGRPTHLAWSALLRRR